MRGAMAGSASGVAELQRGTGGLGDPADFVSGRGSRRSPVFAVRNECKWTNNSPRGYRIVESGDLWGTGTRRIHAGHRDTAYRLDGASVPRCVPGMVGSAGRMAGRLRVRVGTTLSSGCLYVCLAERVCGSRERQGSL